MTDSLPPMTTAEAIFALEAAIKPLRPLLDMERIFQAALAAEREAHDHADEITARKAEREALAKNLEDLNTAIADTKLRGDAAVAATRAQAAAILADAKVNAARIITLAEKEAQAANLEQGKALAAKTAAEDKEHEATKRLGELQDKMAALSAQLAAAEATIAKAEAIKRAMG